MKDETEEVPIPCLQLPRFDEAGRYGLRGRGQKAATNIRANSGILGGDPWEAELQSIMAIWGEGSAIGAINRMLRYIPRYRLSN